jgi:hypothetical protein
LASLSFRKDIPSLDNLALCQKRSFLIHLFNTEKGFSQQLLSAAGKQVAVPYSLGSSSGCYLRGATAMGIIVNT